MPQIRFNLSKEYNDKLSAIKGDVLKVPYSTKLFEKAIDVELKRQNKKAN
tara:strand:- start:331 stop:480 length:150 start_codon:yes stop_codon:yes gene_type:complete